MCPIDFASFVETGLEVIAAAGIAFLCIGGFIYGLAKLQEVIEDLSD